MDGIPPSNARLDVRRRPGRSRPQDRDLGGLRRNDKREGSNNGDGAPPHRQAAKGKNGFMTRQDLSVEWAERWQQSWDRLEERYVPDREALFEFLVALVVAAHGAASAVI